jgi:hypothetical protein
VEQFHEPADSEKCHYEAPKTVSSIAKTLTISILSHNTKHHAAEERKQKGNLEVVEI